MKQLLLFAFFFFVISIFGQAPVNPNLDTISNTKYISTSGSASNNGTIAQPYATFGKAVNSFSYGASGNGTYNEIVFLNGSYTIQSELRQAYWQYFNGFGYKNISVKGESKENVILDGSNSNTAARNFLELLGSGIHIKNLTIKLANATDTTNYWAAIDFKLAANSCNTFGESPQSNVLETFGMNSTNSLY